MAADVKMQVSSVFHTSKRIFLATNGDGALIGTLLCFISTYPKIRADDAVICLPSYASQNVRDEIGDQTCFRVEIVS